MAKLIRVKGYRREGESVSSYVRKVYDAIEGLNAKRGINTNEINTGADINRRMAAANAALKTKGKVVLPGLPSSLKVSERVKGQDRSLQITDEDGRVVGKVDYSLSARDVEVDDVWVDERMRRKGVATKLLDEVARRNPGRRVQIEPSSDAGPVAEQFSEAWKAKNLAERIAKRRLTAEVQEVVTKTVDKARDTEPEVTRILQDVSASAGGRMVGLEHRLKTDESLNRKIAGGAENYRMTAEDFTKEHVVDALRYTLVSDETVNIKMANRMVNQLRKQGHSVEESDIYNYWGEDSVYHGVNIAVTAPNGLRWEVQIHTEDSLERKRHSHHWYKIMRDPKQSLEESKRARTLSALAWKGLRRPVGWESFGSQRGGGAPTEWVGGKPGDIPNEAISPDEDDERVNLSYLGW